MRLVPRKSMGAKFHVCRPRGFGKTMMSQSVSHWHLAFISIDDFQFHENRTTDQEVRNLS